MLLTKSRQTLFINLALLLSLASASCSTNNDNSYTTATTFVSPPPRQILKRISKPQEILELERERNESPPSTRVLKILRPASGSVIRGSRVAVRISLTSDAKPKPGVTNLIVVLPDNAPYQSVCDPNTPPEFQNVKSGRHLLRALAIHPWLESFRNDGAFQMSEFTVVEGGAAALPSANTGLEVDPTKPLLTSSLPNSLEIGIADPLVIDFWLSNAKLKGDGGDYRIRYIIDDDDPEWIDKWEPIWLTGWLEGKHTVRLELIGPDGWPYPNGGYNIITREISWRRSEP